MCDISVPGVYDVTTLHPAVHPELMDGPAVYFVIVTLLMGLLVLWCLERYKIRLEGILCNEEVLC